MSKTDITKQGDGELALLVDNTESLWERRYDLNFFELIDGLFICTPEQLKTLKNELRD